jgi:hypothetical protein
MSTYPMWSLFGDFSRAGRRLPYRLASASDATAAASAT